MSLVLGLGIRHKWKYWTKTWPIKHDRTLNIMIFKLHQNGFQVSTYLFTTNWNPTLCKFLYHGSPCTNQECNKCWWVGLGIDPFQTTDPNLTGINPDPSQTNETQKYIPNLSPAWSVDSLPEFNWFYCSWGPTLRLFCSLRLRSTVELGQTPADTGFMCKSMVI